MIADIAVLSVASTQLQNKPSLLASSWENAEQAKKTNVFFRPTMPTPTMVVLTVGLVLALTLWSDGAGMSTYQNLL